MPCMTRLSLLGVLGQTACQGEVGRVGARIGVSWVGVSWVGVWSGHRSVWVVWSGVVLLGSGVEMVGTRVCPRGRYWWGYW